MSLPTLDEISVNVTQTAPNVSFLTTKSVEGTGVFDVLMKTVKLHLKEEYEAGRVSGVEYTQVYLGALTAVLQQSVTYLLNHTTEERINAEIGLIRQQTVTELTNTDDTIPLNLGFNETQAVLGMVKAKKDTEALQASLVASQISSADAERDLTGQKIISELVNTSTDISRARAEYGYNNENNVVSGVIAMQAAKIEKEGLLVDSQIDSAITEKELIGQKLITELAQTGNDITKAKISFGQNNDASNVVEGLIKSQKDKVLKEADLVDMQIDSAEREKALLGQRVVTELANTGDSLVNIPIGYGYNAEATVAGMLKSQKDKITKEGTLVDMQINSATTENALIGQKLITELANTDDDLSDALVADFGFNSSNLVTGLIKTQKDKVAKEAELIDSQKESALAEMALTGQKVVTELAQTCDDLSGSISATYGFNDSSLIEGMLKAQKDKMLKDAELVDSQKESALAEMALTGQKIVSELANTDDSIANVRIDYGYNSTDAVTGLIKMQRDKVEKEGILIDSNIDSAITEKKLIGQKIVTELAQTEDNISAARVALLGYNTTDTVTGMVKIQKNIAAAEMDLVGQKIVSELANTDDDLSDVRVADYGFNTTDTVAGMLKSQKDKVIKEGTLIDSNIEASIKEGALVGQKLITELAQTDDSLEDARLALFGFNTTNTVAGMLKMQKDKVLKEGLLIDSNIESSIKEGALIGQKIVSELANTDDNISDARLALFGYNSTDAVTGMIKTQKDKVTKEGQLIDSQITATIVESNLVEQKTITELAQTADSIPATSLGIVGYNDVATISGIIKTQKDKVTKEGQLIDSQIIATAIESDLVGQKVITELAQTDNDISGTDYGFNVTSTLSGLIKSQKDKIDAEKSLIVKQEDKVIADVSFVEQQTITELANTADTISSTALGTIGYNDTAVISGLIDDQKLKLTAEKTLLGSESDKAKAEALLIEQKVVTELAQTCDSLSGARAALVGYNDSDLIEGLIRSQIDKLEADEELTDEEKKKITAEAKYTEQKTITEIGQTATSMPGAASAIGYGTISGAITGIVGSQIAKETAASSLMGSQATQADAETLFIDQKTITEAVQTSTPTGGIALAQYNKLEAEDALIDAQTLVATQEKLYMIQKTATELAQTANPTAGLTLAQKNKLEAEDALIDAQALVAAQEKLYMIQKTITEEAQTVDPTGGLIKSQIDKVANESALITIEGDKAVVEAILIKQKVITEAAQTCDSVTAIPTAPTIPGTIAGLIGKQKDKITQEKLLLINQTATELAQTSGTNLIDGLMKSQIDKSAAEALLIAQKAVTEAAQTNDTVTAMTDTAIAPGTVTGYIGAQIEVYKKQKDGFLRDAEQKMAKILIDGWSVACTQDMAVLAGSGLENANISSVIATGLAGIA